MCGRVHVKTSLDQLMSSFGFAQRSEGLDAMGNTFPRWNGAPRQEYPIIVREEETGQPIFKRARWGFIPRNNKDNTGGPQPINARSETSAGYRTRKTRPT